MIHFLYHFAFSALILKMDVAMSCFVRYLVFIFSFPADNRLKKLSQRKHDDYSLFGEKDRRQLPKQLAFVAFQFLSTSKLMVNKNVFVVNFRTSSK